MSDLPPDWEWSTTRDLFAFVTSGSRGWARYYADEGAPFIRVGNLQRGSIKPNFTELQRVNPPKGSEGSRTKVQPNDILISITADLGRIALMAEVGEDCYINQHVALARPIGEVNARYLAWYLSSNAVQRQWTRQQRGVTKLGLGLDDIRSIAVPLPPRPEQANIVDAIEEQLSRLGTGVASLHRARQNLASMRVSAFNDLLSDKDSAGCRDVALGDILIRGRYGTSTKCSYDGKGLPVLRIPNIKSGQIDFADLKYAIDTSADLQDSQVEEGDILIIRTNGSRSLIGRSSVVPEVQSKISFASYLIQLKVDQTAVDPAFLVAALAGPRMRAQIETHAATTAGQYNISLGKIRSLRIPLPTLTRQRSLLEMTEYVLSAADRLERDTASSLARAGHLKSSILAAAFSGELT